MRKIDEITAKVAVDKANQFFKISALFGDTEIAKDYINGCEIPYEQCNSCGFSLKCRIRTVRTTIINAVRAIEKEKGGAE